MTADRASRLYLASFCGFIALVSAQTFCEALAGGTFHLGRAAVLALSGVEILAAGAFLMRPTRRIGGIALALILAVALLMHAGHERTFPAALAFYLCTTLYLLQLA